MSGWGRHCAELGIFSETHVLPEAANERELLALISKLNSDPRLHGILVQAPLPKPIFESEIYSAVLPQKVVDGFHPINVGKLMLGDETGFKPCTPAGIVELLARSNVKTDGAEVVILGRGNIVGSFSCRLPRCFVKKDRVQMRSAIRRRAISKSIANARIF